MTSTKKNYDAKDIYCSREFLLSIEKIYICHCSFNIFLLLYICIKSLIASNDSKLLLF